MENNDFLSVNEVYGLFCDAILTDRERNLVFGSFWGSDTAIRDFQGRLTLGLQEGGMNAFNILETGSDKPVKMYVHVPNIDQIGQHTGRVRTDIYGDMVHLQLYANDIIKPDLANHRALLISKTRESHNLWNAIKLICPVPLLDHWQDYILYKMEAAEMIHHLHGINQFGTKIEIDEEAMAEIVKNGCLSTALTLIDMEKAA